MAVMQSILVAASDSSVRRELFRMLTGTGLDDVRVATSATEALDAQRANPAEIVLVDVVSPPPAGTNLIRKLRSSHPTAIIIGLAAGGIGEHQVPPDTIVSSAFLAGARSAGASATLESPFDKREFIRLVAQFRQERDFADVAVQGGIES